MSREASPSISSGGVRSSHRTREEALSLAEQDHSSFSSVVLPPLQLPRHLQPDGYLQRLPAVEPRTSSITLHPPLGYETLVSNVSTTVPSNAQVSEQMANESIRMTHDARVKSRARNQSQRTVLGTEQQNPVLSGASTARSPHFRTQHHLSAASRASLRIRQQPRAARACGFGERDRRVLDPPPILQVEKNSGAIDETVEAAINMASVIHASLWDECGETDVTFAHPSNKRAGGRLMGTLVASCISANDEHGQHGYFFAFPDLSCRAYGRYRLRFALVRVDPTVNRPGAVAPIVAHAMSDIFTVYSASASTP